MLLRRCHHRRRPQTFVIRFTLLCMNYRSIFVALVRRRRCCGGGGVASLRAIIACGLPNIFVMVVTASTCHRYHWQRMTRNDLSQANGWKWCTMPTIKSERIILNNANDMNDCTLKARRHEPRQRQRTTTKHNNEIKQCELRLNKLCD